MNLFQAAGVDLGASARGRRIVAPRSLRIPLFNHRVLEQARQRAAFSPSDAQIAAAAGYAKKASSPAFAKRRETEVRSIFLDDILCAVLGYEKYDPDRSYTLAEERTIRNGKVDVALGRFSEADGDTIVAPLELKGPSAADLDLIPSGRGRSPVQQAWDYANDAPGSRFVLVSNCLEIRLYGYGRGRDAYEVFDLTKLHGRDEHERLWLLLASDRLLGTATEALLRETDGAFKKIGDDLYKDYKSLRDRIVAFLAGSADGPKLASLVAIAKAQTILDRILFIAFAQRTDLISRPLLQDAEKAQNPYAPVPKWRNFQGLFGWCNAGHFDQDVTAFNGGLFAPDPILDAILLPDDLATALADLGNWDYRSDVPVTILGHLFEQSITDLEAMRAASLGLPEPEVGTRKRHGIVYTPDSVTRFLIDQTLGRTLEERFSELLGEHAGVATIPAVGGEIPWREGAASELAFWRAYVASLRGLTVLDPACGSGAFLVAAFDVLAAEYRRATERLAELGAPVEFDIFDEIVTRNLHGVDLNVESVEISRLSLWLKTARRKHPLRNLAATIKEGDSLIEAGPLSARPFPWREKFADILAGGGFDVVIGNPPYVRMEFIKAIKPYLEEHFVVASDRADLYAYFFERGVHLLKDGGRLGYVSSSTFFRTGSGENLRTFLSTRSAIETVVDFGDIQIFEGVTTYPAILTLRKLPDGEAPAGDLRFFKPETGPADLAALFIAGAAPMPRSRLGAGSWQFEGDALARLRDKIRAGRRTLGDVYGAPLRGIVTGLNKAFVIDRATRNRLVAADPRSQDVLVPFLIGEDVKRWRVEPQDLYLINTPKGRIDIDAYPAVRDWLLAFKPELEARATKQEWFELQQAQVAYQDRLAAPKIVWPHFQSEASFTIDAEGRFLNNKCFFLALREDDLAALLNSACSWFQLVSFGRTKRGGYIEAEAQYVERIAIPDIDDAQRARLSALGGQIGAWSMERRAIDGDVKDRLRDLAAKARPRPLSRKLERWPDLDFAAFLAEVKNVLKVDIPLRRRGEWQAYLSRNGAGIERLTADIARAEREIDAIVYRLFDLDADEIKLLESALAE